MTHFQSYSVASWNNCAVSLEVLQSELHLLRSSLESRGFSHWLGIHICVCLLGCFFTKFGIAIGGFSLERKEPKLKKLGVFWANYSKKHPVWAKLGAFLSKKVYWWVGNWVKNWYRESQIFRGLAGTSMYDFGESNPPGLECFQSFYILCEVTLNLK